MNLLGFTVRTGSSTTKVSKFGFNSSSAILGDLDGLKTGELNVFLGDLMGDSEGMSRESILNTVLKPEKEDGFILHHNIMQSHNQILINCNIN